MTPPTTVPCPSSSAPGGRAAVDFALDDDEETRSRLLPGIASGDVIATVALAEDTGSWQPSDVTATASEHAGTWRIDGHKAFVVDGAAADILLVVARTPQGLGVFEVTGN